MTPLCWLKSIVPFQRQNLVAMILNMILEGYFKLWVEANWCFDDLKPFHTRLVLYVINTLFLLILSKIRNFLLHKKWAHKFHVIHCLNFKMKRTLSYLEKSRLFVFTLLCVFVCMCVCMCVCAEHSQK